MRTRLCDAVVEQANAYFFAHEQLFSGVADTVAVDGRQAVNGAISEMFASEFFTKLQDAKLYRRLHQELWPEEELPPLRRYKQHRLHADTKLRVLDELCRRLRDSITDYDDIVADRCEFARELSIHPDEIIARCRV
jgi:hypothetical protein